jgi:hypothetical protein
MLHARHGLRWWGVLVFGAVLAACGGEDPAADAGTTGNKAPAISGTPGVAAKQGSPYSFTPAATDADNDPLIFGVDAKPAWATFSTTTGELAGTPTSADVGTYRGIVVWVSDGKAQTLLPAFDLTVSGNSTTNNAPSISGAPAASVVAGTAYTFTPVASDQDGNALTFSIRNKPVWASFSATDGKLSGTPLVANVGTFADIAISVSDGQAAVALPAFSIVVTPPTSNTAPVISGAPMTSVAAGTAYTFVPSASDADGNTLTFSIAGLPAWATFNTTTGRLSGTPTTATTGTFSGIAISVSDGMASASLPAFSITVTAPTTNRAPTISGSPSTTATQGTAYSFQPTAADADSDPLTFSIANRPTWATFNVNTGLLSGTPGATNIGAFGNIVISVSDGKASTPLAAFAITVASSNTPPVISGTPATTATVGTQYTFTPTASDANAGTTLTFSITNKPSWATFSTSNGRLQGTPVTANIGAFSNIQIKVTDGQDTTALAAFTITVSAAPNRAPTISGTPSTAVMQGTAYAFTPTASDPDGNSMTFSIANKPTWAAFNTGTGALTGTPTAGDVGTTSGVVITVSDGTLTASLAAFSVTVQAVATGSATLSWTPPTQNTDGSQLTDLSGFKIYWGPSAGNYPNSVTLNNPGLTSYVVDNLVPGTYYFAASALNSAGAESQVSASATKTIQ